MADCEQCADLRAENERLKEQLESPFMDGYETAKEEYRPRLIAAEAENEKLRAALKPFANLTIKGDEPDVWAKKFPRFFELITTARAALEEKQ